MENLAELLEIQSEVGNGRIYEAEQWLLYSISGHIPRVTNIRECTEMSELIP